MCDLLLRSLTADGVALKWNQQTVVMIIRYSFSLGKKSETWHIYIYQLLSWVATWRYSEGFFIHFERSFTLQGKEFSFSAMWASTYKLKWSQDNIIKCFKIISLAIKVLNCFSFSQTLLHHPTVISSFLQWSSCVLLSERSRRNALAQKPETSWIPECGALQESPESPTWTSSRFPWQSEQTGGNTEGIPLFYSTGAL